MAPTTNQPKFKSFGSFKPNDAEEEQLKSKFKLIWNYLDQLFSPKKKN